MNQTIDDVRQIEAKIHGCIKGCETGDEAPLKASFSWISSCCPGSTGVLLTQKVGGQEDSCSRI